MRTCTICNNVIKNKHLNAKYCSVECFNSTRKRIHTKCAQCNKDIYKTKSEYNKSVNHFCSQKCAAKYNDHKYPKRKKTIHEIKCITCNEIVPCHNKKRKYCDICIKNIRIINGKLLIDKNGIDIIKLSDSIKKIQASSKSSSYIRSRINNKIRMHARKLYTSVILNNNECLNCGFKLYVQIGHLIPISSFPEDSLLSTINDINNLAGLCPTCHWGYDNGLLAAEELKDKIFKE